MMLSESQILDNEKVIAEKLFDDGSRPHVLFLYSDSDMEWAIHGGTRNMLQALRFGVAIFWANYEEREGWLGGPDSRRDPRRALFPAIQKEAESALRSSGIAVYRYMGAGNFARNLVSGGEAMPDDVSFTCLKTLTAHPQLGPTDGVYLDNGDISWGSMGTVRDVEQRWPSWDESAQTIVRPSLRMMGDMEKWSRSREVSGFFRLLFANGLRIMHHCSIEPVFGSKNERHLTPTLLRISDGVLIPSFPETETLVGETNLWDPPLDPLPTTRDHPAWRSYICQANVGQAIGSYKPASINGPDGIRMMEENSGEWLTWLPWKLCAMRMNSSRSATDAFQNEYWPAFHDAKRQYARGIYRPDWRRPTRANRWRRFFGF